MDSSDHTARYGWPIRDRRSKSRFNRLRRFFNDYWLVPVVVIYLQLLAALMGVHGDGREGLVKRNQAFVSGVPILYEIATHDFPYAAIGHGKEIAHQLAADEDRPSPVEVATHVWQQREAIYATLIESRMVRHTELGGVIAFTGDRRLSLHAIPSSNGTFVTELLALPPDMAVQRLQRPESRDLVALIMGDTRQLDRIEHIAASTHFAEEVKELSLSGFLHALETFSEAKYLVLPVEFKARIGRMPEWRYAGIYHFHNELGTPPSDVDVASSYQARQFVFCLTEYGFDLYDMENGDMTVTPVPVPTRTTPENAFTHI